LKTLSSKGLSSSINFVGQSLQAALYKHFRAGFAQFDRRGVIKVLQTLLSQKTKKAGIRKKVSVHTLRHTFGAHKADKHMSLATLQELMGHKKKETTLKYIHLAKTNLRQEMVETAL
jgi:site-specific recombinase XerD